MAGTRRKESVHARVVGLEEEREVEAEHVTRVCVDDTTVAHDGHSSSAVRLDDTFDRHGDDIAERVRVDLLGVVTLHELLVAGIACGLELLDRDVEVLPAIELGELVVDDGFDAEGSSQRCRRLTGPIHRTRVDRGDLLLAQPVSHAPCLIVPLVGELRVGRAAGVVDPDRQPVPDDEQLHAGQSSRTCVAGRCGRRTQGGASASPSHELSGPRASGHCGTVTSRPAKSHVHFTSARVSVICARICC